MKTTSGCQAMWPSKRNTASSFCRNTLVLANAVARTALLFSLLLLPMILLISETVQAESVYHVRSGANGANNGSDWANAFTSLPETLVRGATYYVAGGSYPKYKFDDPASGTQYITVKKATRGDHGSDVGWNAAYADAIAVWPALGFSTGYYVFDGVTGGGPNAWTSGFGFRVTADDPAYNYFVYFTSADASNIVIKHVDIGMAVQPNPGCDCAVYSAKGAANITVAYSYLHDIGDVGMTLLNGDGWVLEYNRMDRLARSGAKDGICGTLGQINHGAGIELYGMTNMTIRYNNISNVQGTGWIGNYGGIIQNMAIYGNTFYNTSDYNETWTNGIIYNTSNGGNYLDMKIYNNTFVNLNAAPILGISHDTSGNEFKNNIVYNVNGTPAYYGCMKDFNASDQAIAGDSNIEILKSNPFLSTSGGTFLLSTKTAPGVVLSAPFDKDPTGISRGADGVWDRGASEFSITQQPLLPPVLKIAQQ